MAHNNVCNTLHACRLKREIRSLPFEKRLDYRSELESSKKFVRHELMDSGLDLRGITLPNPIRDITLLFHADMTESGLEKGTCIYGSSGGGGHQPGDPLGPLGGSIECLSKHDSSYMGLAIRSTSCRVISSTVRSKSFVVRGDSWAAITWAFSRVPSFCR